MQKIVCFGILAVALLFLAQTNAKALHGEDDNEASFRHGNGDNMPPPPPFNGTALNGTFGFQGGDRDRDGDRDGGRDGNRNGPPQF